MDPLMDTLTMDTAIVRMSLPELTEGLRNLVLSRTSFQSAPGVPDESGGRVREAMENVEIVNGFTFGINGTPWPNNESIPTPEEEDALVDGLMALDWNVFCCATIAVHNDVESVPRYSNLLYLGTPEGSDAVHHLHVIPRLAHGDEIEYWIKHGSIPPADLARVQTVVLEPGMVVQLDGHCPHWLTVETHGMQRGEALLRQADMHKVSAWLDGLRPEEVVGMFVACAADRQVPDSVLVEAFSSMALRAAGPRQRR